MKLFKVVKSGFEQYEPSKCVCNNCGKEVNGTTPPEYCPSCGLNDDSYRKMMEADEK